MLEGKTIYFLGKLAASNKKEATETVRRHGGKIVKQLSPKVQIVVVGEGDVLSQDWNLWNDQLDAATREAFEAGRLEIVAEGFFWDRLGEDRTENEPSKSSRKRNRSNRTDETDKPASSLYTPSMLAELTGLPISVVRQLQRKQLIVPVRQVHRLSYFDFENIMPLKIVRSMLEAGLSLPKAIDRMRRAGRLLPSGPIDVQIQGDDVLFLTEKGPVDQDGQRRFGFVFDESLERQDQDPKTEKHFETDPLAVLQSVFDPESEPRDAVAFCEAAWNLESAGNLQGAVDLYRAALAAGGPNSLINFQIAELLYRLGDLTGARERYFSAIELDEEFVEARANLGCVLAELGNDDLAVAAFRGALRHHPEYAEVHFHLGNLLKRNGLEDQANEHFRLFLELAPDSPWAERLGVLS